MRDDQLSSLVLAHDAGRTEPALLQQMARHIRRLASRYPHAYFELGQRDEAAPRCPSSK